MQTLKTCGGCSSLTFILFLEQVMCENNGVTTVDVEFNPTVPHCSLATLIGLCMRIKLERNLLERIKLNIYIKKGAHETEDESKFQHHQLLYKSVV